MKLKLSLVDAVRSRDVVVTTDVTATVGDVARYLVEADPLRDSSASAAAVTLRLWAPDSTRSRLVDPLLSVQERGIRSGCSVQVVAPDEQRVGDERYARPVALLEVVVGPDTGRTTYADIEALGRQLSGHGAFVRERQEAMNRVVSDPDFVESIVLSPATAGAVGAAVLSANAVLIISVVAADAMAIVTATVVSTLQLADSALSVSAAGLGGVADMGWALTTGVGGVAWAGVKTATATTFILETTFGVVVPMALLSANGALVAETAESLIEGVDQTIDAYRNDPSSVNGLNGFAQSVASRTLAAYDVEDVFGDGVQTFQSLLGGLGPGYDAIVAGLIMSGTPLGMFKDGRATLGPSLLADEDDALRASGEPSVSETRARASANAAYGRLFGEDSDVGPDEFLHRHYGPDMRARPHDLFSLMLSSAQIDALGSKDEAVIRIIESSNGSYTVQIPSTQEWSPYATIANPNDLTSDLRAMNGDQTALTEAVYAAMAAAEIPPGAPVMLDGFSLGGITAASIAANDTEYNITQLMTVGAPIGNFDLPEDLQVVELASDQDIVAAIDGATSGSNHTGTVIGGDAPPLEGEPPFVDPGAAHDPVRYARMASEAELTPDQQAEISSYLDGLPVDYFARRR